MIYIRTCPIPKDNPMKTLVIHPADESTNFLSPIYEGKGWTVLTDGLAESLEVKALIEEHDRIVMMGHGAPNGLFGGSGMIIDETFIDLLQTKETVYIWCHVDKFVNKYNLKGFYTGMFISELDEAIYCGVTDGTQEHIDYSNELFAHTVGQFIETEYLLENTKALYHGDDTPNPIIEYNRVRLFYNA